MASKRLTKTVTMSLVALAAATGAAVLESAIASAAPGDPATEISNDPAHKIPGLTNPAIKIALKLPGLKIDAITTPAIKIEHKIAGIKIPGVIHKLPGVIETDPQ